MRVSKMSTLLTGAFCVVSVVLGATTIDQNLSDMRKLTDKVESAKKSLDNYNGGIPAALGVARSLTIAQTSAKSTRKSLADREPMNAEEGDRFLQSYDEMAPVLLDAIHSAKNKAPLFKKAGLGPEARTYLDNLHVEKRRFEEEGQKQLPPSIFRQIKPSSDRISEAFDEADREFDT
ncbi:hypothetical protein N7478_005308 [Penicillium angulare]|uniref:uncharacterized protein n=1 Tax=Penicillium angulare TaxID=116970 RepID=UPI0025412413|nr:uncharacterized protein N7478_005308 [Penicillium angulare]KAJ5279936.1 hypothetical protein N7478_005308 [Penicillium angulare]